MTPWKPLDQEPVLTVDETLVCSVVQEGGSKKALFLIVGAYKNQPHMTVATNRHIKEFSQDRPAFMKEVP